MWTLPHHPHSARNESSGDIVIARNISPEHSECHINTISFDLTVRASTVPSGEMVTSMVPSGDSAKRLVSASWRGDSTMCKSHKRIVLSSDAEARSELSGENWMARTVCEWPRNWGIWVQVRASQTSQEEPMAAARCAESGEKD